MTARPALARFKVLCAEAAEQHGVKDDSELAQHIATLRLAREQQTSDLIHGRHINVEHVLKLDEALKPYLPPPKPMSLKVSFVDRSTGRFKCTKCGELNEVKNDTPAAKPVLPSPKPSIVDVIPGAASIRTGRTVPPKNVVPIQTADQRAAELRKTARVSNGVDPGPPAAPRPNYNYSDTESISAFNRRIEQSYR